MGALFELARVSLELRKDGMYDHSVPVLNKGYQQLYGLTMPEWYIERNLPTILEHIYRQAPQFSCHLVSAEYFASYREIKLHHSQWVTSVERGSDERDIARSFLPISHASAGIRYPVNKRNDYLLFVWLKLVADAADAKQFHRCQKEIQAYSNGHLPIMAFRYLTNRHMSAIPNAINGTEDLPLAVKKPLVDIQRVMRDLPKAWEENFGL